MKELKVVVCIKQVPDPEGPPSAFKVDPIAKKVTPIGIPPVINPFDENALEGALRLKDSYGARVIALSLGAKLARPVLRKAFNVGADELILLEDGAFQDLDSYSTAAVLAAAVKKLGGCDLVLAGRQASDWDFGETGQILAELLGIPAITLAKEMKVEDGKVVVQRLKRSGYETVRATMPALITATNEMGNLRAASLKSIKGARDKPITVWGMSDLQVVPQTLRVRKVYALFAPQRERNCVIIEGQSPQEKGEQLALRLQADGVI